MSLPPVSQSDDRIVELTERARAISRDAGTKVTSAFRDMISAGAGIAGFAVESARDIVQYMVRRGQMTQDEADKLIREAEAAHLKRPKAEREKLAASRAAAEKAIAEKKAARTKAEQALPASKPLSKTVKMPPLKRGGALAAAEEVSEKAEKPSAKGASAKAAVSTKAPAAVKTPLAAKVAPPAKPAAKAAAKPAAKASATKAPAAKTPAKKPTAKAPAAKKAVKKKK